VTDMKAEVTESLSRLRAVIAGGAREVAAAMPVSEALFGNLLEAFPILMWATTPDGVPWYLNRRCGEYTGRSMSDVLRLGWLDLIHPEDREETMRSWSHAVQSGSSYCVKQRLRRADGEYRWFLTQAEPSRDQEGRVIHFLGVCLDIDESAKREAARKQAEYMTNQVWESTQDAMAVLGKDYRFQKVNPVYASNWKMPADEIVGKRHADLVGYKFFEETVKPNFERCFAGEHVHFSRWITIPIGRLYVSVTHSPLRDDSGRVEASLMIVRNLTEHMLAAEALRKAQAALARVNRATTLGLLGTSIAHEVNQPLGAIATSAAACSRWLSAEPPDLDKAQRSLERIANDARRASTVVDRLRALVKRQVQRKERCDLNAAIREVLVLTDDELRRNNIVVETSLDVDLPMVECDRVQVQQIILNLIVNAVEAMSTVNDRLRRLTVGSAREDAKAVRVEVRDSGPGIDPNHADQLFEAFYTTKAEGMGMGLSISRDIIEAHGGRLWVSPNVPQGAAFYFSLPVDA
jgi:PAS domain S-box-containing protein